MAKAKTVKETLSSLRWSVKTWGTPINLAPGIEVSLIESNDSPSRLAIALQVHGKNHVRILPDNYVETRGKGHWFRDNVWRLSDAGVEAYAPGIEDILSRAQTRAPSGNHRSLKRAKNPTPKSASKGIDPAWGVYHPNDVDEEFYTDVMEALGRAAMLSRIYDGKPVKVRTYEGDGAGGWLWGTMFEISAKQVKYVLPEGAQAAKRRVLR